MLGELLGHAHGLAAGPYGAGLLAALMNTGVAHLSQELHPVSQRLYASPWVRRLLILVMYFTGTRNLKVSLVLTLLTLLLIDVLLNPDHPWSMLAPTLAPTLAPALAPAGTAANAPPPPASSSPIEAFGSGGSGGGASGAAARRMARFARNYQAY
jgi:hypothetical protein